MDLDELRAFVAVVETGSIVAAARSSRFARATLRRRIDELEARAGVPLLVRTDQGVTPTEAGAVLAARGRVILQEARALISSVREVGAEPAGLLRVVCPVGLPPQLLLPLLVRLRERYPKLCCQLRFADDPVSRLLGDVDVAVHFGQTSPQGPWRSYRLLTTRERLLASPDYLKRRGKPRRASDLAGHDLLSWISPDEEPGLLPVLRGAPLRVTPVLSSSDIHLVRRCASNGLGIAFVPDAVADDLVPVLPTIIGRDRPLRIVVPAALSEVPRIRAILDEVRAFLGEDGERRAT